MKQRIKVIGGAVGVAAALILIGIFVGHEGLLGNLIIISVMIVIVPVFLYTYSRFLWIRAVENQFPNFVRDLADASRSGMSFKQSIRIASKVNYGKLTPEIQTMNNKLSWGIPFLRVIDMFEAKVKDSRIIRDGLTIIKESFLSGGDIASTLDSVAENMRLIKETEAERGSMAKQHVMIMYGIFFMFMGIAIMIIYVMVPMIQAQPEGQAGGFGFSFTSPCENATFFPCNYFSVLGIVLGVPQGIALYYISIFFTITLMQGIFTGLISGQLGSNSVTAGLKHSMILGFTAIGTFVFLSKTGLLPVT